MVWILLVLALHSTMWYPYCLVPFHAAGPVLKVPDDSFILDKNGILCTYFLKFDMNISYEPCVGPSVRTVVHAALSAKDKKM